MKRSRFSDSQIINILKQAEAVATVPARYAESMALAALPFIKWRSRYGGMDVVKMTRLRELEEENSRLKKMYADVQLQKDILQEALIKKW